MKKPLLYILSAILLSLGGCHARKKVVKEPGVKEGLETRQASSYGVPELAGAGNRFALDLFRKVQGSRDNLVFSPYSISLVMDMVYSGSSGETARQMREVLYLPGPEEVDPAAAELRLEILAADTLAGIEILLANAVWAQLDFRFLSTYLANLQQNYGASLSGVDFISETGREESRTRINRWVEENTREKIRDLIQPGVLDARTRMVLTNAVYFKGDWKWAFDEALTAPSLFHVSPRQSLETDFMHLRRTLPYYEDEELQAIRLPYRGEGFSLTILLPGSVEGWRMISRVLDDERLLRLESGFKPVVVRLALPKFRMEQKFDLGHELAGMGMDLLFTMKADLSGMTGEKNLFVDKVVHQAFIELSETGTEAAAATAATISLKSSLQDKAVIFRADHPFIFLVREEKTGSIIFLGRLMKPS